MNAVTRRDQLVLIVSILVASWLGLQAVHEAGHVMGARATGGRVARVVLHPLTISRTDLAGNPKPLVVAWAGPIAGVLVPLGLWGIAVAVRLPGAFLLRFFAGLCLVGNGAYIAGGSFGRIGDCGELLRHGSPLWQLWLFGAIAVPVGLGLWHGQGPHFGLGSANGRVSRRAAYASLIACVLMIAMAFSVGRG